MKYLLCVLSLVSCNGISAQELPSKRFPGATWDRFSDPEEVGFDPARLAAAKAYWQTIGSSAAMLIYRGAVVAAWGDVDRRFKCHSVRKSLLSALYGIHVDKGGIDLSKTLDDLGIDDDPPLTKQEKQARIVDLLKARSGVYKMAAYESRKNQDRKPARGSQARDTKWCYNNWDFNTLCTIFEQETDAKVFEEFEASFAGPLGMQDYRPRDGYYHYERDKSIHPAYPFKLSARDMARFGLLFLTRGSWAGKRILSERWIEDSVRSHSDDATMNSGYGYMWWVPKTEPCHSLGMYSALGVGEQSIDVIPGMDMVFVLRTNTYTRSRTQHRDRRRLLKMLIEAKAGVSSSSENPKLEPLSALGHSWTEVPQTRAERLAACGKCSEFTVTLEDDILRLTFGNGAGFDLIGIGHDRFFVEDFEHQILVERDGEGRVTGYAATFVDLVAAKKLLAKGKVTAALSITEETSRRFPSSNDVQVLLDTLRAKLK